MLSVASTGLDSGTISRRKTVHSVPPSTMIAPISSRGMSRTKLTMISTETGTAAAVIVSISARSEEHTSELQSLRHLVCRPPFGQRLDFLHGAGQQPRSVPQAPTDRGVRSI